MKSHQSMQQLVKLGLLVSMVVLLETLPTFVIGQVIPNDSAFQPNQWSLRNTGQTGGTSGADIKVTLAWAITTGDTNVVLAILDSGIPLNANGSPVHPELRNSSRVNIGPDCIIYDNSMDEDWPGGQIALRNIENNPKINDEFGHGTHVAGIAGAQTNNDTGIAGVGWKCKILAIQVFGRFMKTKGSIGEYDTVFKATPLSVARGIDSAVAFARNHSMKRVVINFSGASNDTSSLVENAVRYADSNNVLIVAGAGNANQVDHVGYPAAYSLNHQNVIAVSGTDQRDQIPSYDVPGSAINLCAPGGGCPNCVLPSKEDVPDSGGVASPQAFITTNSQDIWSTLPTTGYGYMQGTSMATPHVAGTAALMLSVNHNLKPAQIRSILQSTVDVPSGGNSSQYGAGRLNAYKAVLAARTPILSSPANGATVSISPMLTWNPITVAASYKLQVATDSNFTNIVDTLGTTDTSHSLACMGYPYKYYWRVGALIVNDTTCWSATWNFTVSLPSPQLASPSNGATLSLPPTLSWNSVTGATTYKLQVATDSNFSNPAKDTSGITTTSYAVTGLANTTTYYWHVKPYICGDTSHWSDTWYFDTSPPLAPQLTGTIVSAQDCGFSKSISGLVPFMTKCNHPKLMWSAIGWCDVTTYKLYRFADMEASHVIYTGSATSYIDSATITGSSGYYIYYYVKSVTDAGLLSLPSDTVDFQANLSPREVMGWGFREIASERDSTAAELSQSL